MPSINDLVRFRDKIKPGFYDDAAFLKQGGVDSIVLNSATGCDVHPYLVMPEPKNRREMLLAMGVDPEEYAYPALKAFAEIETVSISSARSVFPVRRMGEHHVHKYTRGGRTIAGTMVFTSFNRDAFAEFYRLHAGDGFLDTAPFFVDQIPEFHLLFSMQTEYGVIANAALINVTLSNWGTTLSVHDLKIESTYTYVAQFFHPFVQDYSAFQDLVKVNATLQSRALSEELFAKGVTYNSVGGMQRPPFVLEENELTFRLAMRRLLGLP